MGGRVIERMGSSRVRLNGVPQSKDQYKYVVVFQDLVPGYLLTDNGKKFDNKDLGQILWEVYEVTRVTTPSYHPQANPVE